MGTKPRILLTGATGFVGKAILRELIREEYQVMVLARNSQRLGSVSANVKICECALENITPDVVSVISTFAPEIVIHAAWMGTENTNRNAPEFVWLNLQSALQLFEITVAAGCGRWIAFGSQAEYSDGIAEDVSERMPTFPHSVYGATKLAVCHTLQALAVKQQIECVWLRIFASYGSEYKASYVMPYLHDCFSKQEMPVFKTPHAVWDYIHVDDVAGATMAALQAPKVHGIFNLATGVGHSIGEIALTMAEHCKFKDVAGLRRAIENVGDMPTRRVADINAIKHALNWKPEIALEKALAQVPQWK